MDDKPIPPPSNHRPIIGIVSQEHRIDKNGVPIRSYVSAAHVKFVEGGGARAAPIFVNKPVKYYRWMLNRVNGLYFPGSSHLFENPYGYGEFARTVFPIINEINERGDYFPVWGVCYGFQLFFKLSFGNKNPLTDCAAYSFRTNIELRDRFNESRLFAGVPQDIIDIYTKQNITSHFHNFCMTEKNLTDYGLDEEYRLISVSTDKNGLEFISTHEHKRYPYYGVQYHPEKNLFEWRDNDAVQRTLDTVKAGQYMAQFFVNEARRNLHTFGESGEESPFLIYNYPVNFTGAKPTSGIFQMYFFATEVEDELISKIDWGDESEESDVRSGCQ